MRAALLVLAIAACGLGPAPQTELGPSTGNAPWRDLGPVRLCLGEQSFAPPSDPPGGLCVRETAAASACATDADCASRESCVCGRCTVAYCAVASDCEAPRFCNFSQHRCDLACGPGLAACAPDEQCLGGVCRGRCVDSTDCQFGEVCENNVCIGDDCDADATCLAGERCDLQRIPKAVREPGPLSFAGRIYLYLDIEDAGTRAIWRAVSDDGIQFRVDLAPVIADGRAPSAVVDDGVIYLYFERADGIALATSASGDRFTAARVVLAGTDLTAPTAIHAGGIATVYYARAGQIGLATGFVGDPLVDDGPVLAPADVEVGDGTPGTAFWTPITELASPHAIVAGPPGGEMMYLYFAAFGTESPPGEQFGMPVPIPANFSIGFAAAELATPDAPVVWPYGPVADRVDAFLDHLDELGPAALERAPGAFRLYYVEATHDATPAFQLGRVGVLASGR